MEAPGDWGRVLKTRLDYPNNKKIDVITPALPGITSVQV